jgi:hypothetical protein
VSVRVLRRRFFSHRYVTLVSVATSAPARVKVLLQTDGRPVLHIGKSASGRDYSLRLPWPCLARARRYNFTVTADSVGAAQSGAGQRAVRRGVFTIDTPRGCDTSALATPRAPEKTESLLHQAIAEVQTMPAPSDQDPPPQPLRSDAQAAAPRAYLEIAGMARSSFMMSGALASGTLFRTAIGMPRGPADLDNTGEALLAAC